MSMGTTLTYHWLHIPTGAGTENEFDRAQFRDVAQIRFDEGRLTRLDLLEVLNEWNRQGKGDWVYWL
jgi:hypothetical protein